MEIFAGVVVAAHGSWEPGPLTTERNHRATQPSDWLAFKAHFRGADLPAGLMPLLSFSGGYGGMVHCDEGLASLSCCVRFETLGALAREPGEAVGDAVLRHMLQSTPVLAPVLARAERVGTWLAAGPIQPGIRGGYCDGVYIVGNAAGEAHPVVAEGISMALQSSWLLAERLIAAKKELASPRVRDEVGRDYARAWRRSFAGRIRAAAAIAAVASRQRAMQRVLPLLATLPALVTAGARLSGKVKVIVREHEPATQQRLGEA
jgi:flavin-dependent dehydrogenase